LSVTAAGAAAAGRQIAVVSSVELDGIVEVCVRLQLKAMILEPMNDDVDVQLDPPLKPIIPAATTSLSLLVPRPV
jgi:hypothetical protein